MSRDDGFPRADIDSSYLDDAKMRALWQRIRDENRMARAVLMHEATVLASWRHGERVTAQEAAPTWLTVDDDLIGHLQAVRLLDRSARIPSASWSEWFGAAIKRRTTVADKGRLGGLARARNRASRAVAGLEHGSGSASGVSSTQIPATESTESTGTSQPASQPPDAGADPADAYWSMSGRYPTGKPLAWIDDLTREFGAVPVIRALASAHQSDPTVPTLLGRAQDILRRESRSLDLRAQAAERERIARLRADPRPRVDPDAVAAELRRMMGATA